MRYLFPAALLAAAALTHAHAQCTYQTSLLGAFRAVGNPEPGQVQQPNAGWTFRRSDHNGELLVRLGNLGPYSYWGTTDQPFGVPIVGPVMSPDPLQNQSTAYRRLPSFTGVFFHPGYPPIETRAVLSPQAPVSVTSLSLSAELLGSASPDAFVGIRLHRPSGDTILIPSTRIESLAAARVLSAAAGVLPVTLNPGDQLQVWADAGASPAEDWLNVNATVTVSGAPIILVHPPFPSPGCAGGDATLRVASDGATSYHWRHNGEPIEDDPGHITGAHADQLLLTNTTTLDEGLYDCVVRNSCASVTSSSTRVAVCLGDFNCDGGVDGGDVDSFFGAWESGESIADINADGGIDGADVDFFFSRWENGC